MNPLSRNRHSPSLAGHGGRLFDEIEVVDLRLLRLVGWWNGWRLFLAVAFLEVVIFAWRSVFSGGFEVLARDAGRDGTYRNHVIIMCTNSM